MHNNYETFPCLLLFSRRVANRIFRSLAVGSGGFFGLLIKIHGSRFIPPEITKYFREHSLLNHGSGNKQFLYFFQGNGATEKHTSALDVETLMREIESMRQQQKQYTDVLKKFIQRIKVLEAKVSVLEAKSVDFDRDDLDDLDATVWSITAHPTKVFIWANAMSETDLYIAV